MWCSAKALLRVLSISLIAVGIVMLITLRVVTIDLTEGRSLTAYWEWWLLAPVIMGVGLYIFNKVDKGTQDGTDEG